MNISLDSLTCLVSFKSSPNESIFLVYLLISLFSIDFIDILSIGVTNFSLDCLNSLSGVHVYLTSCVATPHFSLHRLFYRHVVSLSLSYLRLHRLNLSQLFNRIYAIYEWRGGGLPSQSGDRSPVTTTFETGCVDGWDRKLINRSFAQYRTRSFLCL